MRRSIKVLGACAVLIGLAVTSAVGAAAKTIRVDDDGTVGATSCTGGRPTPALIQAAIDKARPDDTILVCGGTYTEQLTLSGVSRTGVTILAVKAGTAKVVAPAELVGDSGLLTIDADQVTVRGLRLLAPTAGSCQKVLAMVAVTGTRTVATSLRIAPKGTDTYGSCGYLTGIEVRDGGTLKLMKSTIVDFRTNGVDLRGAGSRARISGSTISFLHASAAPLGPGPGQPSAGVSVLDGAGGKVLSTTVTSRASTGPGSLVLGEGILTSEGADGFLIDGVTITDADEGIFLGGSSGATLRDSTVTGGLTGVRLATQTGSTLSSNEVHVTANGIYLDTASTGNTLTGNDASGPTSVDCYDESGTTAETVQNTWTSNVGDSIPTGICTPAS